MTSVPPDFSKLTVPQLKALCKERRITGYSKLSKAALLRKLTESTAPSSNHPIPSARNPAYTEPPIVQQDGNAAPRPISVDNAGSTPKVPSPTEPAQARTVLDTTIARKGTKRPAHIDVPAPQKRIKPSQNAPSNANHDPPPSTFKPTLPVDSQVFKVPELPAQPKDLTQPSAPTVMKQPSNGRSVLSCQITAGPGRFKPLVVSKPKHVEPSQGPAVSPTLVVPSSLHSHSIHAIPLPVLSHISFPPKASERKWVHRWAVILSALSDTSRKACQLVSRTFRYAVYLSAAYILSRNYPGRRLDAILRQHPGNMTNLWPYLRFRRIEVEQRRHAFEQSFLGRYTLSIGYDPLSKHLWTSPDDEKQVDVALRFVLTRMWFALSVGSYGHDASTWSQCIVRDAREVVQGEIWQVIVVTPTGESCSFYVLEATCEVIGQPPLLPRETPLGHCLRADWTTWISRRAGVSSEGMRSCTLLESVKWSNTEEYHQGISKAWLVRVQGQDADSVAKRDVAEKYILASVMANGISGRWMTMSAMAQEFAGLPDNTMNSRRAARIMDTVNMYLPVHHHIESVHFTTSKGVPLHNAVAIVQTPGREYYILRDNGMQIGCEEEGIAQVWQLILACNQVGKTPHLFSE